MHVFFSLALILSFNRNFCNVNNNSVNFLFTSFGYNRLIKTKERCQASSRINHDDVKEYVALMRRDFSDEELASYELQGREAIIKDIAKSNIIEQARIGATNALVPMLRQLGFDEPNIIISFRKNFTQQEVEQLVDASTIEKKNGGANR